MSTKVKSRRKGLTDEQRKTVCAEIRRFEFKWWYDRRKITYARNHVVSAVGFPVSAKVFRELREEQCEWFKVEKRPRPSTNVSLNAKQWAQLRAAVKYQLDKLQGRTLDEAVAIVCLVCKCNAFTLSGLTSELHVWKKP